MQGMRLATQLQSQETDSASAIEEGVEDMVRPQPCSSGSAGPVQAVGAEVDRGFAHQLLLVHERQTANHAGSAENDENVDAGERIGGSAMERLGATL